MEQEFGPLKLAAEVEQQLKNIANLEVKDFSQYVDALREVASLKILKQVNLLQKNRILDRRNVNIAHPYEIEGLRFIVGFPGYCWR